ncbi:helix-hairpin-helix domain-containing protein [Colwellia sp. TT2012]|uniref:helix-hairpin-helix domain-containing protein n=1 Tax=Colwellia sp. TT2012 TaxID=1720342 RepID=UPI000710AC06|nr:helix-hairpin-helix domain-containing protein [Colwellia sp. TT2012]
MNPSKVFRDKIRKLTDLPNIGKAGAADLELLGIEKPDDLMGQNPYEMYERLCIITGNRHDPCVIDVFISVTCFINGDEPKPWWAYTAERKSVQNAQQHNILASIT